MALTITKRSAALPPQRPLRVCYFGTYRAGYTRNRVLIEALRRNGVDVVVCHENLWQGEADRVDAVQGKWKSPAFWKRVAGVYYRLLRQYLSLAGDYDVMVVGYPGQFDVFLARFLSWLRGRPLAWDVLVSLYLIVEERGLAEAYPAVAAGICGLERIAVHLPERMFLDSSEYIRWLSQEYNVSANRFRLIPTGADGDRFRPAAATNERQEDADPEAEQPFNVVYHGTFLSTHGLDTVMQAAHLLQSHNDIHFTFVGDGVGRPTAVEMADTLGLHNVTFTGWVDDDVLSETLQGADIILGAFGVTVHSYVSVQHKIYEGMALCKPVLTAPSPAVEEFFQHGVHLYTAGRADPYALAAAIVRLQMDPQLRCRIASQGHELFRRKYAIEQQGKRLAAHLRELTDRP